MLDHGDREGPGEEEGDGNDHEKQDEEDYHVDDDQSECVDSVKAQQDARKSDPRGHEDLRSRGFGDTRPALELPWLTSPAPEHGWLFWYSERIG